jgi:uncharacterized protein (TIGR02145 family)
LPSECNEISCAEQIKEPHQGICPDGFHIPTDYEWTVLINVVENVYGYGTYGKGAAAEHLRDQEGWEDCGNSGTYPCYDSYGFSALPSGRRSTDGVFGSAGLSSNFWSATESNNNKAYNRLIVRGVTFVTKPNNEKSIGYSVRCVRVTDINKPLIELDNAKCGIDPADLPNTSGNNTGLVFGDGYVLSPAWVKDNGDGYCEGYAFLSGGDYADIKYDRVSGCWRSGIIASCDWRVSGDSLKIGYSAMARDGVRWKWTFDGTYKISGNDLTLSSLGEEPVVYTKRGISPMCQD